MQAILTSDSPALVGSTITFVVNLVFPRCQMEDVNGNIVYEKNCRNGKKCYSCHRNRLVLLTNGEPSHKPKGSQVLLYMQDAIISCHPLLKLYDGGRGRLLHPVSTSALAKLT